MSAVARRELSFAESGYAMAARAMTFDECYERHWADVYRLCLRYGGGRTGWAEDLTQDVFMKLLEHLPRLERHEEVGAWLYRVGTNHCVSRLRSERSWLTRAARFLSPAVEEETAPALDELFEARESARKAMLTLGRLPVNERVALSMKILDGKGQREIAETLSFSEGYVSKLLARAWQKVRAEGWEDADGQA